MERKTPPAKVRFEVGGQTFSLSAEKLETGPPSKLKQLYTCAENKQELICIERPAELFAAILALYQTQELHIPLSTCPSAFLRELQYWDLGVEHLADCCLTR